jgi:hypothetical protein
VWVFGGTNKIDLINEILPENNYHSIADILEISAILKEKIYRDKAVVLSFYGNK